MIKSISDSTLYLEKYRLAQNLTSPMLEDCSLEQVAKICNAIVEAAELKEELYEDSDGEIKVTISQALVKLETLKMRNSPKMMFGKL